MGAVEQIRTAVNAATERCVRPLHYDRHNLLVSPKNVVSLQFLVVGTIYLITNNLQLITKIAEAIFCRGAEIRTRTKRSQSVRATVTQHPVIYRHNNGKLNSCQSSKSMIRF